MVTTMQLGIMAETRGHSTESAANITIETAHDIMISIAPTIYRRGEDFEPGDDVLNWTLSAPEARNLIALLQAAVAVAG